MAERKPEQAGKYDGKKGGTALPDINAGENEIEKNAAWAVKQGSAGANTNGILLIRSTPEFRLGGMKARGG